MPQKRTMYVLFVMIFVPLLCRSELIDLTFNMDNETLFWPSGQKGFGMKVLYQGINTRGVWVQREEFQTGIHVGTHMDAPRHFAPQGRTAEQIPIKDFMAPAVIIDIREAAAKTADAGILATDLVAWEKKYGRIPDGAVVLQCSGWTDRYPNRASVFGSDQLDRETFHFPSFELEAVQWMINNRNIVGLGVDTPSIDCAKNINSPVHVFALSRNIYGLENVKDTCKVPPSGATLYAFPIKIKYASGALVRVVASWDTDTNDGCTMHYFRLGIVFMAIMITISHI